MNGFGNLNPYADQATLRYRVFRSAEWDVTYFDDMQWEEDEYDVPPHTVYFVYYDDNGTALGCFRLVRTDIAYTVLGQSRTFMLRDSFNGHANAERNLICMGTGLPAGKSVREGTRFVIAPELFSEERKDLRRAVISEMAVGLAEYCVDNRVSQVVAIMPPHIWQSIWAARGCPPAWIGPETNLDGKDLVRAGALEMSEQVLAEMRRMTRIKRSALTHRFDFCTIPPKEMNLSLQISA
jgi:N-acyl-L-homoserine lactone synthetase